jgi:VanZ family protein
VFGLWIAIILAMSSIPNLGPPDVGLPWADKVCHLGEYGVLGWLFARVRGGSGARRALAGALVGACMGAVDENYQRLTPGRDVSGLDVLADIAGASLGAFLGPMWLDPLWRRWRRGGAKRGT